MLEPRLSGLFETRLSELVSRAGSEDVATLAGVAAVLRWASSVGVREAAARLRDRGGFTVAELAAAAGLPVDAAESRYSPVARHRRRGALPPSTLREAMGSGPSASVKLAGDWVTSMLATAGYDDAESLAVVERLLVDAADAGMRRAATSLRSAGRATYSQIAAAVGLSPSGAKHRFGPVSQYDRHLELRALRLGETALESPWSLG